MTAEVFENKITSEIVDMYKKLKENQEEIAKIRACMNNSVNVDEDDEAPADGDYEEVYIPKGDAIILNDKDC
eukprot:CAMPEP_0170483858 /NCGR_PEP_ID=MMETSP0208-20121228/3460_1 /TAXON_ID=197538 /ORGANISM="Strombidium inclinatum, Strain S3" /LENGTH=71 /DNA_ID=CAMNT_0010757043 /DNA_START=2269 /DNA_END=2484 /DNA_ORIENTATION=-